MKLRITLSLLMITALLSTDLKAQNGLPNLNLNDLEGNSINVSQYATNGKVTVFCFWATWCGPCKKELDAISDLYEPWTDDYDVEVIAVTTDDQQAIPKVGPTVASKEWPFTVLFDVNQEFKLAMGGSTIPFTVVVDKNGNVIYSHTGYIAGDEYDLEEVIEDAQ